MFRHVGMSGRASVVVVLVLALSGCTAGSRTGDQPVLTTSNTTPPPSVAESLTSTDWMVDTLIGGQTVTSAGATESLAFDADTVTISGGCLTGTAHYQVTDSTIRFSEPSTTIAPCTQQGATVVAALLDVLDGDVTYKIDARALTLTTAGGQGVGLRA